MEKIKKVISFFLLSLGIVMIFNFRDHGSIFPKKPNNYLNHDNCSRSLTSAFIDKAKANGVLVDESTLNNLSKSVCNCAKSKSNMALNEAVSYCINEKVGK